MIWANIKQRILIYIEVEVIILLILTFVSFHLSGNDVIQIFSLKPFPSTVQEAITSTSKDQDIKKLEDQKGKSEIDIVVEDEINKIFAEQDAEITGAIAAELIDIMGRDIARRTQMINLIFMVFIFLGIVIPAFFIFEIHKLLFGKKSEKKYAWGVIRDSFSGHLLSYASCKLYLSQTTNLIDQVLSDGKGVYGFSVNPGVYRLEVNKSGYESYSKEIKVTELSKEYMRDIYLTNSDLKDQKSFRMSILNPLLGFLKAIYKRLLPLIYIFGLSIAIINFVYSSTIINIFILGFYFILFVTFIIVNIDIKKEYSSVIDSESKLRVSNALVKFYDTVTKNLVDTQLTNQYGYFNLLEKPGDYIVNISARGYDFPSKEYLDQVVELNEEKMVNISIDKGQKKLKIFLDPK